MGTHRHIRGHPCTRAHTQQVTHRVLQAEALMQGTGSGKHPKLPNMASVAYMYKCGQPLLKASNNKGLKPERATTPLSTRKLPRPGYGPWRTAPPGGSDHLRERPVNPDRAESP